MTEFTIEPARPDALAACFALLPELAAPDAVLFTARDADGVLAGAGGMLWRKWGRPAGLPAWIQVLPDCRKRGAGRALLDALAALAATEGGALNAFHAVDEESDAAAFALACGARAVRRHYFFAADPRNFLDGIGRIVARLQARGAIPPEAQVIALADAPVDEVKWLVSCEMATAPPLVEQMLAVSMASLSEGAPIDITQSCVLMMGKAVAGALLSRNNGDAGGSMIVCNVVAPAWRGGWANALLLDRFTRRAIAANARRIAFDCADDVKDTIGLARRSQADTIAVRTRFAYAAADAATRRR